MKRSRAWEEDWSRMAEAARAALANAKGRPRRGAVVQDDSGRLHGGSSINLPDLPAASLCAEQSAIAALCASAEKGIWQR